MVGAKRSKGALVSLVVWLLLRIDEAEGRVVELEDRLAVPGADELTRLREERDHYRSLAQSPTHNIVDEARFAAGIREGLERAATAADVLANGWVLVGAEMRAASAREVACRARALKEQVK